MSPAVRFNCVASCCSRQNPIRVHPRPSRLLRSSAQTLSFNPPSTPPAYRGGVCHQRARALGHEATRLGHAARRRRSLIGRWAGTLVRSGSPRERIDATAATTATRILQRHPQRLVRRLEVRPRCRQSTPPSAETHSESRTRHVDRSRGRFSTESAGEPQRTRPRPSGRRRLRFAPCDDALHEITRNAAPPDPHKCTREAGRSGVLCDRDGVGAPSAACEPAPGIEGTPPPPPHAAIHIYEYTHDFFGGVPAVLKYTARDSCEGGGGLRELPPAPTSILDPMRLNPTLPRSHRILYRAQLQYIENEREALSGRGPCRRSCAFRALWGEHRRRMPRVRL